MEERIQQRETVERRSISMYESDWQRLDEYARRMGLDTSSTMRMLLRTHPEMQRDGDGKK